MPKFSQQFARSETIMYIFFAASSEGSIPMGEHEQLFIVELDQGDGWTRVRRQTSLEEGFVPTSYVRITLYSNC